MGIFANIDYSKGYYITTFAGDDEATISQHLDDEWLVNDEGESREDEIVSITYITREGKPDIVDKYEVCREAVEAFNQPSDYQEHNTLWGL